MHDSIATHADPDVAEYVIHTALLIAQLAEVPDGPAALAEFVELHLASAARLVLGRAQGDRAVDAIRARLIAQRSMPGAVGVPTLRLPSQPFAVVIVGRERDLERGITDAVPRSTRVLGAHGAGALVDHLRETRGLTRLVFLDDVDLLAHAADEPELLARSMVVLRGATPGQEDSSRSTFPRTRFVRCSVEADAEDLSVLLRLGAPPA